jgi:PKD repeat protein
LFVNFDASSSTDSDGHISTYSWSFGDGGSATGVAASHTYTAAGYYVATLTVRDETGGTDSVTHSVSVTAAQPAPISISVGALVGEFEANEVAGDLKYKGRLLAVVGYVESIDSSIGISVVLVDAPDDWTGVRCYFPESEAPDVANLRKGDLVTIVGECMGMLAFNVGLDHCRVQ